MTVTETDIRVVPVAGSLGAEIRGFDLRDPDADLQPVLDALHEYEVVFFRRANLTEDEQMVLGRRFGTPSLFPMAKLMGATEPKLTVIDDHADSPIKTDYWHTDVTWTECPPKYALLQALVVPERGGDTMWASTTSAYETLSPPMQEFLCGLTAVHSNESFIRATVEKMGAELAEEHDIAARLRAAYPPVEHPVVRTHPVTKKRSLLWGGRFISHIVGLSEKESETILEMLLTHISDPRLQVRWQWDEGDLAIWDERSTAHRSAGDHGGQFRSIRRMEIDGDRPFFDPAASHE